MTALAIILARSGSKGLPRKNVLPVADRPCLLWTFAAALAARQVSRVVLSSDDAEAQRLALDMGIGVVVRPAKLAVDDAAVDEAARHAVAELEAAGEHYEEIVLLYGNVPVRPVGLIDRALQLLRSSGCDSVQSYAPVGKHHPWWTVVVDKEAGQVSPWQGEVLNHGVYRRQDLPAAHIPDGGVIAVRRAALLLEVDGAAGGPHQFLGADRRGVVTGAGEVVDIDSEIDLLVADAILRARGGDGYSGLPAKSPLPYGRGSFGAPA